MAPKCIRKYSHRIRGLLDTDIELLAVCLFMRLLFSASPYPVLQLFLYVRYYQMSVVESHSCNVEYSRELRAAVIDIVL